MKTTESKGIEQLLNSIGYENVSEKTLLEHKAYRITEPEIFYVYERNIIAKYIQQDNGLYKLKELMRRSTSNKPDIDAVTRL